MVETGENWVLGANWGVNGSTVADHYGWIDGYIAAYTATGKPAPEWVFFNAGVNDCEGGLPDEATWKTQLAYILDAYHAAWPNARVRVTTPWVRSVKTHMATLGTWIGDVVSARSTWAAPGDDERVWLEGGDDGATMTLDGSHYSVAGRDEKAQQMLTIMGY